MHTCAPGRDRPALDAVLPSLHCPVCSAGLERRDRLVECGTGHRFDVARQGYLNLAVGRRHPGTGDSPAMVLARESFLAAGHFRPIADAVAAAVRDHQPNEAGLIVDLAGGTGYYLARVLTDLAERAGLCLELSPPALQRAARAHPRAAAVGADVWQRLPVDDAAAAVALSIFGPRNAAELNRVLVPGGLLVVVSPTPAHLCELREPMGLIGVDPDKDRRQDEDFARFATLERVTVATTLELSARAAFDVVAMGPTARHVDATELSERARALPPEIAVTSSVTVAVYRRPG